MPTTGRVAISRARGAAASVDMEVDAEEDERPEDRRQQPGADRLEAVNVLPVVVGRRHDGPDHQIDHEDPADADARRGGCSCIAHVPDLPFACSLVGSNAETVSAGTRA